MPRPMMMMMLNLNLVLLISVTTIEVNTLKKYKKKFKNELRFSCSNHKKQQIAEQVVGANQRRQKARLHLRTKHTARSVLSADATYDQSKIRKS